MQAGKGENHRIRKLLKKRESPLHDHSGRGDENCVDVVYDIIEKVLNIDPENIQFHAVHRIGKPREATDANPRPIIARFLCREDRDNIYGVKRFTLSDDLVICSLNARGLSNTTKRREIFRRLKMKGISMWSN